jgi:hypothetical protein
MLTNMVKIPTKRRVSIKRSGVIRCLSAEGVCSRRVGAGRGPERGCTISIVFMDSTWALFRLHMHGSRHRGRQATLVDPFTSWAEGGPFVLARRMHPVCK